MGVISDIRMLRGSKYVVIGLDLTHGHMIGGNSYVRQHRSVLCDVTGANADYHDVYAFIYEALQERSH